jgi:Rrf2 family protein
MAPSVPPVISQTAQYALQALTYLSGHQDEEPILGHTIAEAVGIPQNYLSKIMHTLGKAGLVDAKRGKLGGYALATDPATTSIREVFDAFDDLRALETCFLGRPECSDENPCAAHEQWGPIAEALQQFLDETTLADLSRSAGILTKRG